MISSRYCEKVAAFGCRALLAACVPLMALNVHAFGQAPTSTTPTTTPRANVGMLRCNLAPSVGLILGGHQTMTCRFTPNRSLPPQDYTGVINTVGLDIGFKAGGVLAWAVLAPTQGPPAGGLAGLYVGASGEVGLGVGAGANVLIGGSNRSIALQPLSVEGEVGVNLALGLSGLELRPAP